MKIRKKRKRVEVKPVLVYSTDVNNFNENNLKVAQVYNK